MKKIQATTMNQTMKKIPSDMKKCRRSRRPRNPQPGAKVDEEARTPMLLHEACKEGDVDKVKKLWSAGANIDVSDNSSSSSENPNPLHYTGKSNRLEMVKLLIALGADVNKLDNKLNSPLHKHCAAGNADVVKLLLQSGANVEAALGSKSPLHVVAGPEVGEIIKLLLSRGISIDVKNNNGQTPLHWQFKSVGTIDLLLAAGANVNEGDNGLRTPLHYACRWRQPSAMGTVEIKKRVESIQTLLKAGALIDARDGSNKTPMEFACDTHPLSIEVLLQSGADVNIKLDESGRTPLHYIIEESIYHRSSFPEKMKILLKYGADMEAANEEGLRPIHVAGSRKDTVAIKILLEHGADIDGTDREGKTCLSRACELVWESGLEMVEFLLECGANPNIRDENGKSSLHYSRLNRSCRAEGLVKSLLRYGVDVDLHDTFGNTAIHYDTFIYRNYHQDDRSFAVLKMLVDGGADVNLKNKLGDVPLQVHYKNDDFCCRGDAAELFLEAGTDVGALNIQGGFLNLLDQDLLPLFLDYGVGDLICSCTLCSCDTPVMTCAFNQLEHDPCRKRDHVRHTMKVEMAKLDSPKLRKSRKANKRYSSFRRSCEKEVDLMNKERIGDSNFTYYDLLRCQNSSSLRGEGLPWSLTANTCREKFPIYGDLLYSRFAPIRKKLLFDHCSYFFELTDLPRLPPECAIEILKKLGHCDLLNVAEVCNAVHVSPNLNNHVGHAQP